MTPDSETTQTSKNSGRSRKIVAAISDWLYLLDGPRNKVFTEILQKEDWGRLFKLLSLVLILSGAILGTKLTVEALYTSSINSVFESRFAIIFLIIGAMLGVAYNGIAYLFGIKISLPKSFFIILSLGLPWVPVIACIDLIPTLPEFKLISVVFLLSHFILVKPIFNFYRGVVIITKCNKWRALTSILAPIILFTVLLLYMFVD